MSLVLRVRIATDKLERAANPMSLAELSGKPLRPAERLLARIEENIDALGDAVSEILTAPAVPDLTPAERSRSAVDAITSWARAVGAAIVRSDSAHRMVTDHASEVHRGYWLNQSGERIFGLVAHEIGEALEAEGVLAWRANPDDGYLRLVDTKWLQAHADVYGHVFDDQLFGHRCRFCRMAEIPTSNQLQAVDPEKRKTSVFDNGVPRLPRGVVLTHARCRPYWDGWYGLACQYKSLEEALEADKAAGRESKMPPPMAEPEPVEPLALPSGYSERHFNSSEQNA